MDAKRTQTFFVDKFQTQNFSFFYQGIRLKKFENHCFETYSTNCRSQVHVSSINIKYSFSRRRYFILISTRGISSCTVTSIRFRQVIGFLEKNIYDFLEQKSAIARSRTMILTRFSIPCIYSILCSPKDRKICIVIYIIYSRLHSLMESTCASQQNV